MQIGGLAGVSKLLSPVVALADACHVDPTERFTDTTVFGLLQSHFDYDEKNFLYRSWGKVLDRLKPMSDYEMSWVASYFPNFVFKNEPSSDAQFSKYVDEERSGLIRHLNDVQSYINVFNKLEADGVHPSALDVQAAVSHASSDENIPEPFRRSIVRV